VLGQSWQIYMGQCVSRKAGAVVAASGHHNSPSYRIMDKAQKQVSSDSMRYDSSICFPTLYRFVTRIAVKEDYRSSDVSMDH